jgi:predicted SnoaL-like aldol condensation-catalyzing enzyme
MSNQAAQAVVRRFIKDVFVDGRVEAVDALVTPDFRSHPLPGSGPEVMQAAIQRVAQALTGPSMTIEDIFGEGDRVAVRLTSRATQSGEFMGMPATGRTYEIEELHIFRVEGDRIAEHWHQMDAFGMLRQLGAMPSPKG